MPPTYAYRCVFLATRLLLQKDRKKTAWNTHGSKTIPNNLLCTYAKQHSKPLRRFAFSWWCLCNLCLLLLFRGSNTVVGMSGAFPSTDFHYSKITSKASRRPITSSKTTLCPTPPSSPFCSAECHWVVFCFSFGVPTEMSLILRANYTHGTYPSGWGVHISGSTNMSVNLPAELVCDECTFYFRVVYGVVIEFFLFPMVRGKFDDFSHRNCVRVCESTNIILILACLRNAGQSIFHIWTRGSKMYCGFGEIGEVWAKHLFISNTIGIL